ncbi:hypothetical protein F7Q92_19140 [Ideonella dechloratans]|uniref:Uncharacterized protein n=1 Tax=Ideonella dechloratans TaxID=36863 RepID=A0A643F735_IDEDE|nr:hypothetical protein [Ideonella dechloratans]KAB0574822.1 hypothetical protein F7Q92_19140 [Ideonella dechloratans]UFU12477.1 hypothetical protein LRM40_19005 [Ideonella dechloratans]
MTSTYTPDPNLLLSSPAATNADLVFGAVAEGGAAAEATLQAQLPALRVGVRVAPLETASLACRLPGLRVSAMASYDSNVQRPTVGSAATAWQVADQLRAAVADHPMQQAVALPSPLSNTWSNAQRSHAPAGVPLQAAQRQHRANAMRWQEALGLRGRAATARWQEGDRSKRQLRAGRWQEALGLRGRAATARWQECDHSKRQVRAGRWQEAHGLRAVRSSGMGKGLPTFLPRLSRWQEAIAPSAGRSTWGVVTPPIDPCYLPDPDLVFWDTTQGPNLVFICDRHSDGPAAVVVVPTRRIYMVLNEVALRRVDGDLAIVCPSLQLSADVDSWTWGWSASVPASEMAKLEPGSSGEMVQLVATVNGQDFSLVLESMSRDRQFGSSRLSIGGRGLSAVWDAPYAAERSFGASTMRTAQQLALQALEINGVPSSWGITWAPEDWSVPAGAWSFQGTPIGAITRIAEAAGAYVQSSPASEQLLVLPRYPVAPWAWGSVTPDFELPAALATREAIEWSDKAVYNRVFVSGESAGGVLAQITRTGTAGDQVAAMITDALCTDVIAGRQRGMPVLADVGRQAMVSLRLPVLPETGIIVPGKFVRYVDGGTTRLGLTRSVAVESGRPSVWQTIGVQTYE